MRLLKKLLLVLTPIGAAAFVAGGGTFGSFRELAKWTPPSKEAEKPDPLWKTKKLLLAVMLIGVAAYLGVGGTFANFQAETSNNGSSISSGTLTLGSAVNGTACWSYSAVTADNVNAGCNAPFTVTNLAPGGWGSTQLAKIDVQNGGSIDGQSLYMYASQVNGKLSSLNESGGNVTSLTIQSPGMEGTVGATDSITVSDAGRSQVFTVNGVAPTPAANSNGGATTINVTPVAPTYAFPSGSTVQDTSGNGNSSDTDCYDTKLAGESTWTDNPITGAYLPWNTSQTVNPLCGSLLMWIQEYDPSTGYHYCWSGKGSQYSSASSYTENANGLCVAPIYATTSGISGTITSIPISTTGGLNGNVAPNDTVVVTQGSNTESFTAASTPSTGSPAGSTSIAVNSQAVTTPFTAGAIVTDTNATTSLDGNAAATDSISSFDTAHHWSAGKQELFPLNGNGSYSSATGRVDMPAGTTRTFYVGVYLPKGTGLAQNPVQGLTSTFGLSWHMDQLSS